MNGHLEGVPQPDPYGPPDRASQRLLIDKRCRCRWCWCYDVSLWRFCRSNYESLVGTNWENGQWDPWNICCLEWQYMDQISSAEVTFAHMIFSIFSQIIGQKCGSQNPPPNWGISRSRNNHKRGGNFHSEDGKNFSSRNIPNYFRRS